MAKSKRRDDDEAAAVPFPEVAEKIEETITEPQPPAPEPVSPTDFAMSLEEYGICRGLRPSVTAGLKAFLRGDARPRKLSAWDRALERFQKA